MYMYMYNEYDKPKMREQSHDESLQRQSSNKN